MIDTIRIRSESISDIDFAEIKGVCVSKNCVDMCSGELLYTFVSGKLQGTHDYRIRFELRDKEFVFDKTSCVPVQVDVKPFLIIECSIHKLLHNHNLFGGISSVPVAVSYLVSVCENCLGLQLPSYETWEIERLDFSKNFDLGNIFNVTNYLKIVRNSEYSRREGKTNIYGGGSTLFINGSTTSLKMYSKGLEFSKHDRKRLLYYFNKEELENLSKLADKLLRVEVEIYKRKLIYDLKKERICCYDINEEYLNNLYSLELKKLLKINEQKFKITKNYIDVKGLLNEYYPNISNSLFGFWTSLSVEGERSVRRSMSKSTFYKYRKILIELGISWLNTDIKLVSNNYISDFYPSLDSKYLFNRNLDLSFLSEHYLKVNNKLNEMNRSA